MEKGARITPPYPTFTVVCRPKCYTKALQNECEHSYYMLMSLCNIKIYLHGLFSLVCLCVLFYVDVSKYIYPHTNTCRCQRMPQTGGARNTLITWQRLTPFQYKLNWRLTTPLEHTGQNSRRGTTF